MFLLKNKKTNLTCSLRPGKIIFVVCTIFILERTYKTSHWHVGSGIIYTRKTKYQNLHVSVAVSNVCTTSFFSLSDINRMMVDQDNYQEI